jgi:hypothetical protein
MLTPMVQKLARQLTGALTASDVMALIPKHSALAEALAD